MGTTNNLLNQPYCTGFTNSNHNVYPIQTNPFRRTTDPKKLNSYPYPQTDSLNVPGSTLTRAGTGVLFAARKERAVS